MKGEFQGHHLGTGVSFIVIDASPRSDPKLHRHFYEEIIVVQESTATFTTGSDIIDSTGGQGVVVLGSMPHKFVNSDAGRLRPVDIRVSERSITEWLED